MCQRYRHHLVIHIIRVNRDWFIVSDFSQSSNLADAPEVLSVDLDDESRLGPSMRSAERLQQEGDLTSVVAVCFPRFPRTRLGRILSTPSVRWWTEGHR